MVSANPGWGRCLTAERVLVTREIPEAGLRLLEEFDTTALSEEPPERGELLEATRGVDGVLSVLTERIDPEFMHAAGENLKVVANTTVSYENIDGNAAKERGITITNTPEVRNETTADTAFLLLLAAARRLWESERLLRAGKYTAWGPRFLLGRDVWGKRLVFAVHQDDKN